MKIQTQTLKYPVEIGGIPGLILTISVSAEKNLIPALEAVGFGSQELPNKIKAVVEEVRDALDGSVTGLIVSNLED